MSGWIGLDLDGTVAQYDHGDFKGPGVIGAPIPKMVEHVKALLAEGNDVRIMTARVSVPQTTNSTVDYEERRLRVAEAKEAREAIDKWTTDVFGRALPVTCVKDFHMWYLLDDRAKQVLPNTGTLLEEEYQRVWHVAIDQSERANTLQSRVDELEAKLASYTVAQTPAVGVTTGEGYHCNGEYLERTDD